MKKVIMILALLIVAKMGFAQQIIQTQKLKVIDSLLTYLEKEQRFMGAFSIRQNNQTIFNKAYGAMGEKDGKLLPANADTRYRIGSISKSYTAVMILQLQEEDRLSLNDKLAKYFKEIPNAEKITLKQLLQHQSGLYNYTDADEWHTTYSPKSQQDMLAIFKTQQPIFEPGAQTNYCNTNYMLLGYIIEQVTGKSFDYNLQTRIAKKLKLKHTSMPENDASTARNEAVSFSIEDGKWIAVPEIHVSTAAGAGGIIATADDVNLFYEALLQGKLLKEKSLQQMMPIPGQNNITPINSYGMGIHTVDFGSEHRGYGHSGHIDAFSTMSSYFPDDKLAISLFDNGVAMSVNEVAIGLLSIIFDQPYIFPDFNEAEVTAAELKGLEGVYAAPDFPLDISVMPHGKELWAQGTGQDSFRLTALSSNKFEFKTANIMMTFARDKDGAAYQVEMKQGGSTAVLKRKDPNELPQPDIVVASEILAAYEGVYSAAGVPIKITIKRDGDKLSAQATGQSSFPLKAINESEFSFALAGIKLNFKRDDTGKVVSVVLTQGEAQEFMKE